MDAGLAGRCDWPVCARRIPYDVPRRIVGFSRSNPRTSTMANPTWQMRREARARLEHIEAGAQGGGCQSRYNLAYNFAQNPILVGSRFVAMATL